MFAVYAAPPDPDAPLASLVVDDRPEPAAADGWVTVRPAAASLNMHDLWTLRGVKLKPDRYPIGETVVTWQLPLDEGETGSADRFN